MRKRVRTRVEVNLPELEQILEQARQTPLSEGDYQKLKHALRTLVDLLTPARKSEKTKAVLAEVADQAATEPSVSNTEPKPLPGHGRHGAAAFTGARRVAIRNAPLQSGERCPACEIGKVYRQKKPKPLVRIVGQAPLAATVYELERWRCNACGQVFTAEEPEEVGLNQYDETTAAMIAQLKYGSGVPFYRLEKLQASVGIPLPASTQWEMVEEAAQLIKPALEELIRQGAQGEVLHNDDTRMRVLRLAREPSDERIGVFSGIVSTSRGQQIALYFTGRQHAGENLADVLRARAAELHPPIQMCDALSRNVPKLATGIEILLANCLAHGRRLFVDLVPNFPTECRHVLEQLGHVYGYEAEARERELAAAERLTFHQQHSGPVMDRLHGWLEAQLTEKRMEPNSGLGKAINYLLRHWRGQTAFLRTKNAPLDNNVVERALKRVVLHRKNALYYRTLHGAAVGDWFMSLIHSCELCGVNSFDYLTQLLRHARELATEPARWMPWNYRDTLAQSA